MRKVALVVLAIAMSIASVAPSHGAAATLPGPCGSDYLGDAATQLQAIEDDRDASLAAVVRRSTQLATIAGPDAAANLAISRPCAHANASTRLRDLARLDTLVAWSRVLALRATDSPIYPKPYKRVCYLYDLTAVQNAFIEAWTARLANRGTSFSHRDVWLALGREPLFAHVSALASETAHRLGVRDLPTIDSDEAWWLAANRNRHRAIATQLAGISCGPKVALYGLPPVERTTGFETASTRR